MIKIQEGRENDLSTEEKRALRDLRVEKESDSTVEEQAESIVERAMKRLKADNSSTSSSQIDTSYLLPTSNLLKDCFLFLETPYLAAADEFFPFIWSCSCFST